MNFPIQFQFDNANAADSFSNMCQVFDATTYFALRNILAENFSHVVAWDAEGVEIWVYDNR